MREYILDFLQYFIDGGYLMLPLLLLSIYIYYIGFDILFRLYETYKECRNKDALCEKYKLVDFNTATPLEIKKDFSFLRIELLSGINRSLKTLKILSGVAPLIGLLGTVSGMMIAIGAVGSFSIHNISTYISKGISEALITTQCGLSIAIPAIVLCKIAAYFEQKILINLSRHEVTLIRKALGK